MQSLPLKTTMSAAAVPGAWDQQGWYAGRLCDSGTLMEVISVYVVCHEAKLID